MISFNWVLLHLLIHWKPIRTSWRSCLFLVSKAGSLTIILMKQLKSVRIKPNKKNYSSWWFQTLSTIEICLINFVTKLRTEKTILLILSLKQLVWTILSQSLKLFKSCFLALKILKFKTSRTHRVIAYTWVMRFLRNHFLKK